MKTTTLSLLATMFLAISTHALAYDSNPYTAASAVYKVEIQDGNTIHLGTGTLISRNKILTNCHVVKFNGNFRVIHQQSGAIFPTRDYYNLGNYDACVLEGDFGRGTPIQISTEYQIGENVWHFGYPQNMFLSGQGLITGMVDTISNGLVIESGSFCNPGSSGGPLMDVKGKLIALTFGVRSDGSRDKCLSIPMGNLTPYLR